VRFRRRKRAEFSKILLGFAGGLALGVTVYGCILSWITRDTSMLAYLIPAAFGELATATGFYYHKARAENQIKLRKQYGPEIYNDAKES